MTQTNESGMIVLDPTRAAFNASATVNDLGVTHFIGIGGAGMSVLAEMLVESGVHVTGSDRSENARTLKLAQLGARIDIGQRAQNVAGANTVVYSSAIKAANPEIVAAYDEGAHIVHRSDILALLMNQKRSVSVAGAHGKTTTSSLLAHILVYGGTGELADPSYAIGASIQGPDGTTLDGGHAGTGNVLVAEADESDGSFLKYHPDIAIVTNVEADHLDHYGTPANYRAAFVEHIGHAQRAILCIDDDGALDVLRALPRDVAERTIAYGTTPRADLGDLNGAQFVQIASEHDDAQHGTEQFTIALPEGLAAGIEPAYVNVALAIPGLHNARNATAAIIAAALLGMNADDAAKAAASFLGAARRFQTRGSVAGVSVIDDYAHHPTEIAALLAAARRRFPTGQIHVLFQPHLFSRTQFFALEFAQALSAADDVIVASIYPAREKAEDFPDISNMTIVEASHEIVMPEGHHIEAVSDMSVAAQMLAMRAHAGDAIFTVGAGDVTSAAGIILHALTALTNEREL